MSAGLSSSASRPLLALAVIVGPALLLAGCGTSEPAREEQLICPRPAIVNGLDQSDEYKPGADGQPEALRWIAQMQNIGGGCSYDDGVDVHLSIDLIVEPGPAFQNQPVNLRYFVAVAGPDEQLIDKQMYTSVVTIPPGAQRGGSQESFTQHYDNILPAQGAGYRIYFGFDLPEPEAMRRRNMQQR
jgi:hypothetical protein